jgi:hypothetical protein
MTKREDAKFRISTRQRLWKEQEGICIYCNRQVPADKASLDHIIPVDLSDERSHPDGLVMTCKRCNKEKLNYIVFTNLYDRIIYPMIDTVYIYQAYYIQKNFKDKKNELRKQNKDSN